MAPVQTRAADICTDSSDCTVTVDEFIPAQTGQDVTAVWNYVKPQGATQVLRVDWFLEPGPSAIITFYPPSTSAPAPGYANKLEASVTDSEARLTIKNFDDTSDEGRYRCEVLFLVGSITETEEARTVVAVPVPGPSYTPDKLDAELADSEARLTIKNLVVVTREAPPSPASPSISGYTEDTFVASGSPLTLTCTSQQGKPPADLTWYKGTTPLSAVYSSSPNDMGQGDATSVLNIAALQQADNGAVYQCRASQPALAQDQNTQVTVSVAFFEDTSTSITGFPGTAVDAGTPLTLTCTSGNSNPAASITWYRDGTTVTGTNNRQQAGSNGGIVTTQDLVISLQPEHNGARYTCRATNSELGLDRDSSAVGPLNVRFFQSGTTISGNSPVTAGTSLTLTCTSGNSNPAATITWTWGGTDATGTNNQQQDGSNGGKITTQQLVLSSLQPGDNGMEVRCVAVNSGLSQTQEDTVIVVVNYGPRNAHVTCNPSDLSDLREGGALECTCTSDSNPAARYSWTYGTAGSTPTGSLPVGAVVDQAAGTLTFDTLDKAHSGDYRCTATNSISSASSGSITVDVKYPPSIISITPAVTVDEFDDVSLTCTADSNPAPDSFSWSDRNGTSLPRYVSNQGFTLTTTITDITYLQAGTYTCTAGNGIGAAASAGTNVTVEYAPKVYPPLDPYPAAIGESVSLECSASAVPNKITFTWSKNGKTLTNSSRLTVQSSGETSVLSISGVEEGDYGTYNCTTENEKGSTSTRRTLQPLGPPGKPTELRVLSKNAEFEVGITWTAGFNGGLDTTHTVQVAKVGADQWENIGSWEQTVSQQHRGFDVTLDLKAQEAGDYQIRIRASNAEGWEL
ncbi:nephrin-like [Branchiostoma floridae x Branchiostoma belcheri]